MFHGSETGNSTGSIGKCLTTPTPEAIKQLKKKIWKIPNHKVGASKRWFILQMPSGKNMPSGQQDTSCEGTSRWRVLELLVHVHHYFCGWTVQLCLQSLAMSRNCSVMSLPGQKARCWDLRIQFLCCRFHQTDSIWQHSRTKWEIYSLQLQRQHL